MSDTTDLWCRDTFAHDIPDEAMDTLDVILAASEDLTQDEMRRQARSVA